MHNLTAAPAEIERARSAARLLDSAIRVPGTNIRFGLDALLGIIPGLGDAAGAVFSGYLILIGSRLGLPQHAIIRMVANVAVDTIVGGVPVLGDLFDVAWKSNTKNLELLERHTGVAGSSAPQRRPANKLLIAAALLMLLLLLAGGIWLAVIAVKALIGALS
jgi:hypothetical protein